MRGISYKFIYLYGGIYERNRPKYRNTIQANIAAYIFSLK